MATARSVPLRYRSLVRGLKDVDIFLQFAKDPKGHAAYNRVVNTWRSIGLTVLQHPDLPDIELGSDLELLESVIKFKRWFFTRAFQGLRTERFWNRTEHRWDYQWVLPRFARLVKLIKQVSVWITFYGSFDLQRNRRPKLVEPVGPVVDGYQVIPWFGGCLRKWGTPWKLPSTKHNVFCISQIASFGRSLPCPSQDVVEEGAEKTLKTLSSIPDYPEAINEKFMEAAFALGKQLPPMGGSTHVSISGTGCFERTQGEGGYAQEVVNGVREILDLPSTFFTDCDSGLFDCFGRLVLDPAIVSSVKKYPNYWVNVPFSKVAYRKIDFELIKPKFNPFEKGPPPEPDYLVLLSIAVTGKGVPLGGAPRGINMSFLREGGRSRVEINQLLGEEVLLWAMSKALAFGSFAEDPVFPGMAVWPTPKIRKWVQFERIPAEFMSLAEPGWKARPLTKNMAWLNVVQQALRHSVDECLRNDPRMGLGIESAYALWDMLKILRKRRDSPKSFWINADLSEATNRIPHGVLRSIWSGFFRGNGPKAELLPLTDFVLLDHEINYKGRKLPHLCGSFMGEPMSFCGLNIYNACVVRITNVMTDLGLNDWRIIPSGYIEGSPEPALSVDAIIGDDLIRLTESEPLIAATEMVYQDSNAVISIGKYTISWCHGILAENHVFSQRAEDNISLMYEYIDLIKSRLLSPSTRVHSDNRSSIIGKGSALSIQLEWYADTHPELRFKALLMRNLYLNTLERYAMTPSLWRMSKGLPVSFPNIMGGINLSSTGLMSDLGFEWEQTFLSYLLYDAPLSEYFTYVNRLNNLNSAQRRNLQYMDYSTKLGKAFMGVDKLVNKGFNPTDQSGLYTLSGLLDHLSTIIPDRSKVTGKVPVNMALRYAYTEWGFYPVEALLDQYERLETYTLCFTSKEVRLAKPLSIGRYLRSLRAFWKDIKLMYEGNSFRPNRLGSLKPSEASWAFSQRFKTLIHISNFRFSDLASGPTLAVDLSRSGGLADTKSSWDEYARAMVRGYLAVLPGEETI